MTNDTWKLGNHEFTSRFILGSGKYSLELIKAAVEEASAQIVTMRADRDHGFAPGQRRRPCQYS